MQLQSLKRRATPHEIIFFITSKCNAKCSHCFLWRDLNADDDVMNLEQIGTLASSLSPHTHIGLTGGEPFLREDLPEIANIFYERTKVSSLAIATHGGNADLVHDKCEAILRGSNAINTLNIMVSVLGLEETHDKIRGLPGKFKTSIMTIERLIALRKHNPNLVLSVLTVIMRDNYAEIEEIIKLLRGYSIGIFFTFIRGNYSTFDLPQSIDDCHYPNKEEDQILSMDEMKAVYDRLCEIDASPGRRFLSEFQKAFIRRSMEIVEQKKLISPCYAGQLNGTIYPNGDVALCEQVKPFGNLRESGYDLGKLWHSDNAKKMRKKIQGCSCIHSCTLNTSVLTKAWLTGEQPQTNAGEGKSYYTNSLSISKASLR